MEKIEIKDLLKAEYLEQGISKEEIEVILKERIKIVNELQKEILKLKEIHSDDLKPIIGF